MKQDEYQIAFQAGWKQAALDCVLELQQAVVWHQRTYRDCDAREFAGFVTYAASCLRF